MQISFVGMRYRKNYNRAKLTQSMHFKLKAEPTNPYDNNAIKGLYKNVAGKWVHFGYVPRDQNTKKFVKDLLQPDAKYNLELHDIDDSVIKMVVVSKESSSL